MVRTSARQVLLLHHFRRILAEAAARGLEVAPLKGAHLATSVYPPEAPPREMGDVDFLVRARDWEAALEMLVSLGLRPRRPLERVSWQHEVGFLLEVAPGREILFEVHRTLFEPSRLPLDHEELWERTRPSTLDGAPCRRLAPEDHVVHLCLHEALHRFMHLERTMCDVEMLFRHGGADATLVVRRAREWRAMRATWLVASLAAESAPSRPLERVERWLRPDEPVRTVLRRLVRPGHDVPLVRVNHRLGAALLWPFVFDDIARVARFVAHHPVLDARLRRLGGPSRRGAVGRGAGPSNRSP